MRLSIGPRALGPGEPAFLIAEAGVNHDGDPEEALRLVRAAKDAGADAVKFQTFDAEKLAAPEAAKAAYQARATGGGESQAAMLRRLELPPDAFRRIARECARTGILFLSTPFDEESCALLFELGVPAVKIGSGELTNPDLLSFAARGGRPLLLSTGMATLGEVEEALRVVREAGDPPVALLQCQSNYPADPRHANLRAMETMRRAFGVPVGYSDHTEGLETALAAAALGASILEKHFTLDRRRPGPDHAASLEPARFRELVEGVRLVEAALGDGRKRPAPGEEETARAARRRIVAAEDLPAGALLAPGSLALRRAGSGLPPSARPFLLGRRLKLPVAKGQGITGDLLA